ncbi:hypothetical protein KXV51_002118 [Aspergillus fumigatus]|nr:hypothetical protein KXV51_002118 [Aspergillus fumigatus]KAH2879065.1 hypothetical protein KXW22_002545 [Aspergillus fumigatus]KAH3243060.1 hypothetical protein KXW57_004091 [Aspergillus fumigatus]KAH3469625.1 hypothetical protein KXW89_004133 [Aspergillus fumigatus]
MRDQLLVADTREKALEEHHKVLAGARGTSTVIAYMDVGGIHKVVGVAVGTPNHYFTDNQEAIRACAESKSSSEWLPGMTGSVATNGPTSMLKELRIAWGPSGPALVLYAMGPHGPEPGGAWCFGSISLDLQELIACPTYLHGAPAPHGLTALTED